MIHEELQEALSWGFLLMHFKSWSHLQAMSHLSVLERECLSLLSIQEKKHEGQKQDHVRSKWKVRRLELLKSKIRTSKNTQQKRNKGINMLPKDNTYAKVQLRDSLNVDLASFKFNTEDAPQSF